MLGQHLTELYECCVGMLGDKLSHFFFKRCQFLFPTASMGAGSDLASLAAQLEE
jgi:hypothetical protein